MPWDVLTPVLATLHSATVVECGAFDGATAERIAALLPDPPWTWHAFECDPRNLENCRANPIYARPGFHLHPLAVAERDGEAVLFQSSTDADQWTASSSLCGPTVEMPANFPWLRYRDEDRIQVASRSLDSFADEVGLGVVDLLWCDVEGGERRVIEGARRLLERTRFAFLEVWEARIFAGMWTYAEVIAALAGWEVVHRFPGDVLLRNTRCP